MRKYLAPTIGVAAFVIGGLITRAKALDGLELIETRYLKKEPEYSPEDEILFGDLSRIQITDTASGDVVDKA